MNNKTPKEMHNDILGSKMVKALEKRHYEAYYCQTFDDALKTAVNLIPENSSISWGGSVTIREMGLTTYLKEGNYKVLDRDMGETPEEKNEIQRQGLLVDFFLTSTNAITEDGILINIDGNGNRVAAMCYGPKNVIVICGMNKVTKDVESALSRARNYAAPVNAMRFMGKTPCVVTGSCGNCTAEDCICSKIVVTRTSRPAKRTKVILVGEDIGF